MTLNILFIYDQSLSFYLEGMNFSLIQVLSFVTHRKKLQIVKWPSLEAKKWRNSSLAKKKVL